MPHTQATYEDANLILRLYELRREPKLRQARDWFVVNFKADTVEEMNRRCPPGSEGHTYMRMVLSYWDMVASFITSGVLNEELFFESGGEMLIAYERIKNGLPEIRDFSKSPQAFKNLEEVGKQFIEHMNRTSPDLYPAWSTRINSLVKG